ncbi:hypothetical protein [Cohnella phaseoli]|uniref:Uncharacterized protein n=1 Tax=Cohnella phaseoli TaxID=456490 RepID=A0A3D9ID77_9BACL|nr:hypothetical protein [Cohnella phaseoli]RED59499.1 hypothetical protein DFP98_13193 [Cohnella phaseoli]
MRTVRNLRGTQSWEERIALLRRLEEVGYSIAYYVLRCEELAEEATRAALLQAGSDREISELPAEAQREKFSRLAMSTAIAVRREKLLREAK